MGTIPHYTIKTLDELVSFVYGHEIKGKKKFYIPGSGTSRYVFRGQCNKNWHLIPSFLRKNNMLLDDDLSTYTDAELVTREYRYAMIFMHNANEAGLPLPEKEHILNIESLKIGDVCQWVWPHKDFLYLLSIMQHYQLPTRLLDWTFKCDVALYFAISGWLENKKNEDVAIWALYYTQPNNYSDIFNFYIPPYYKIGNIKRQHGLFTYIHRNVTKDVVQYKPFDKEIEDKIDEEILYKIIIKKELCIEAYDLLRINRCIADSIYDGFDGIKKKIVEVRLKNNKRN